MYLLIVEDDKLQYQYIHRVVEKIKPTPQVARIKTEQEFYQKFEETATDKPDVILMDIMLRWSDPAPVMEQPPPEVVADGFYRAGLRCARMLLRDSRTCEIPIIIHSVLDLDADDLQEDLKKYQLYTERSGVNLLPKNFDDRELERALMREMKR